MVVTSRIRGWLFGVMLGVAGASCPATAAAATEGPVSALEFRLDGDFSIAPLIGTSLSWKHYGDNGRGWRLGLSPRFSTENYEGTDNNYETRRQYGLTVECQRLGFMASRSSARPYWGFGVLVGGDRGESELYYEPEDGAVVSRNSTESTYRAGLVGTLGAEFTIAGKLVIGAEYSIAATWSRDRRVTVLRDDIIDVSTDNRYTDTSYGLYDRPVAMTIAILF